MAITKYLKEKKKLCKTLINDLSKKFKYVSILGVDTTGTSIRTDFFSTTVSDSNDQERGFVVKIYDGIGYLEYSFNDIRKDNLNDIENKILSLQVESDKRVKAKMVIEDKISKTFSRDDEEYYELNEILSQLNIMKEEARKGTDLIINCKCSYERIKISKIFISQNKDLEQDYSWTDIYYEVISRKGDVIKNARATAGNSSTKKAFEEIFDNLSDTIELAINLLDSKPIAPGIYDVITAPSITGLIAHEAFGHGVEMDMIVKNRAKSKDYFEQEVASPIINMHDGASAITSVASYFFDDDGVLSKDTTIIREGVLINGMSDLVSAAELDVIPSGNGRRESFTHKSYTRMTNTFFTKGSDKLEDMIKSIDYGFYLCDTNNGMEDPKNWQIQCICEYAREIKNGKFTGNIFSPVVISGYVLDLLKSITMVSDDFKVDCAGFCGKGYKEWVRVSDGGPHLKARVKLG